MSAFALVIRPTDFSIHLLPLTQRSPTQSGYRFQDSGVSFILNFYLIQQAFWQFLRTHYAIFAILLLLCSSNRNSKTYCLLNPETYTLNAAASVLCFSPVTSSAQADSTSELLRFL